MGNVIFIDGFDHYTTVGDKGWVGSGGYGLTTARNGSGLYAQGNWQGGWEGEAYRDFPAPMQEAIFGFALRSSRLAAEFVWFQNGGTIHLSLAWDGASHLQALRGHGGTVLGTTTSTFTSGQDKYVEVHVKIHPTTGFVRVYINGALEINFTGNTQNGGSAQIDRFRIYSSQITFEGGHNIIIDDLYIVENADASSLPYGDSKVETDYPSGNGNSSAFVGSDGNSTDNYLLVDEAVANGDTDYVESGTVAAKDTYAFSNLASATGSVKAVQVNTSAKKTDAGARDFASISRLGATEVDGTTRVLTTSYAIYRDIYQSRPGGGAWSIADVNAAEFGHKVVA